MIAMDAMLAQNNSRLALASNAAQHSSISAPRDRPVPPTLPRLDAKNRVLTPPPP